MLDIVELQRKLIDIRNQQIQQQQQQSINAQQYQLRIASLETEKEKERQEQARKREVVGLLDEGYDIEQVAYILDYPPSEGARIEEYNQSKRKFLMTGKLQLPGEMVGITIG